MIIREIKTEIQKIDSSTKKLREFGFQIGGVLAVLGVVLAWRGKPTYPYFLIPGMILILLGAWFPSALYLLQRLWMTLSIPLVIPISWVMARLILTVLFYIVITPIALILRLTGKDLLDLKIDLKQSTYWRQQTPQETPPSDYERQF